MQVFCYILLYTMNQYIVFLSSHAGIATADSCTGKNAEECKVNNTSRLTWTLFGVLLLIDLILLLILCCIQHHVKKRIRDLSESTYHYLFQCFMNIILTTSLLLVPYMFIIKLFHYDSEIVSHTTYNIQW